MTTREVYRLIFSWLEIQTHWSIGAITNYKTARERDEIDNAFYLNLAAILVCLKQIPKELEKTPLKDAILEADRYLLDQKDFHLIKSKVEGVKECMLKNGLR